MEESSLPQTSAREGGAKDTIKEVGDSLCSAMTEGFCSMAKALETIGKTTQTIPSQATTYMEAPTDLMHDIDNGLETIKKIEEHIDDLRNKMNIANAAPHMTEVTNTLYERRVNILTSTLSQAYKTLENLLMQNENIS